MVLHILRQEADVGVVAELGFTDQLSTLEQVAVSFELHQTFQQNNRAYAAFQDELPPENITFAQLLQKYIQGELSFIDFS